MAETALDQARRVRKGEELDLERLAGWLSLDDQRRVRRELDWALIKNGVPTALQGTDSSTAVPP